MSAYGPETVLTNSNGMQLRCETFSQNEEGASYLRVCDPDGKEIMYWSCDEWQEEPQFVIGAIMGYMNECQFATEDRIK